MQTRSLFAILIVGVAVGIAFAEDHDIASLEEKSLEELASEMVEAYRAFMLHADSESQKQSKLELAEVVSEHPEVKENIDLPVNQFCDLVLEKIHEDIPKMSPSQQAAEKKIIIGLFKTLDVIIAAALISTE
uniref:Mammaglobin-A-like n=1 Tax=Panagrellus redivivus TaxID=6233 RepID=A0A7E4WA57_PANRE